MQSYYKWFTLICAAIFQLVVFQNCGSAFDAERKLASTNFESSSLVETSEFQGDLYLEDRIFTGFVCSNNDYVRIQVGPDSNQRIIAPALKYKDSAFSSQNKYIKEKCGNKTHLSVFSATLSKDLSVTPYWRMLGKDTNKFFSPTKLNKSNRNYGILYHTWHCPVSTEFNPNHVFDLSKILSGQANWGPLNWQHWVGQPFDGYYCLENNPGLIKKHAVQLVNAGIDYIYIDITNWPYAYKNDGTMDKEFRDKIHGPLMKILSVYKDLQTAGVAVPKVVPWIGTTVHQKDRPILYANSVARWAKEVFHPNAAGLRFSDGGKPFLFYKVANGNYNYPDVKPMIDQLTDTFYAIPKWANVDYFAAGEEKPFDGLNKNSIWSYLEDCQVDGANNIVKGCKQRTTSNQASVASAYQHGHMLSAGTQPKNNGITLYQQFQGAMKNGVRFVSIAGWNEWLGRRQCVSLPHSGNAPLYLKHDDITPYKSYHCGTNGRPFFDVGGVQIPFFADALSYDRSRSIEPNRSFSDCYYQLLRYMIHADKSGQGDLSNGEKRSFKNRCGFNKLN